MSYSIILSATALQEESEAYLFYENKTEGLGDRFLMEVENALHKIAQHPSHYTYIDETKTIRNVAMLAFPFIIIYEELEDKVVVYHIHHTSKDLK